MFVENGGGALYPNATRNGHIILEMVLGWLNFDQNYVFFAYETPKYS